MLLLAILLPFVAAFIVPLLSPIFKRKLGYPVAIVPAVLFLYFLSFLPQVLAGNPVVIDYQWIPQMGIDFSIYLDGLALLFALIITGIGFFVVVYSIAYLGEKENLANFYNFILLFMGSMVGVVTTGNLLAMYVFWELTSVSSFLLIGFWFHKEESRYGALKSMLITVFGGLSMLAGFIFLYLISGSFNIREIVAASSQIVSHAYYLPALILILLGAFTKSTQFPFHIWLPNAMEAPTPVSAYLHSATMVKAGLYLLARLTPALGGTSEWFWLVSGVGLFTLCYGSFMAVRQTDLKALLAFSTISQLGLITALFGFSTKLALAAAFFHIFNHSTFKGALFMVVGIVDHETGTRDIRQLGGLRHYMPVTAMVIGIAAFSMAGIPLLSGFYSKELFFTASLALNQMSVVAWLFPLMAVLGSIFTFLYSMMLVINVFGGKTKKTRITPQRDAWGMLWPPMILASINILVGFFPHKTEGIFGKLVAVGPFAATAGPGLGEQMVNWNGVSIPLLMSATVIVVGFLLFQNQRKVVSFVEGVQNHRFNLNVLYDKSLIWLNDSATWLTAKQMTGFLRDYLVFIMLWFVLSIGGTLLYRGGLNLTGLNLSPVGPYEIILALVLIGAAFGVVLLPTRLAAILSLSSAGAVMFLFWVNLRAPDLALTQLIVETVSTVLFLLAFAHLPELKKEVVSKSQKYINMVVAGASGLLITLMMLSGNASRFYEPIANYYLEQSLPLGGGHNVVNVVLVDFRGFDTMGEITVIAIASLAVYALIKLRPGKRGNAE
ncbi:MAG: hydrogen gas-evolving membrane-bound hydrogenase subunit E [Bacillota bacterium]